jgi:predicted GIY-YIG superfamily endonuclease
MWVTYALIDQRSTAVFYVGLTNDLRARYTSHIYNKEVNKAKNQIIDEMRSVGMIPYCRTLEINTDEHTGRESERRWIAAFLEIGEPLTNVEGTGRQR